jgi:hypothetical protein
MNVTLRFNILWILVLTTWLACLAQDDGRKHGHKFEQLGPMLRSPNVYRTASGAPGHQYWQQRADYEIEVSLNDENQSIEGKEKVTYYNQSPDPLNYLWLQLDHNQRSKNSDTPKSSTNSLGQRMDIRQIESILWHDLDLDVKILYVTDKNGKNIPYTINKTMMRLDLEVALKPGERIEFNIGWRFNVHDRRSFIGGRSGYEYFEKDGNYIYTMAEWFPRMAVYSDFEGWQNKQFLGRGEFALTFGNYKVKITVPEDHMVAATGVLQNPAQVMNKSELDRWNKAKQSFDHPVIIRTQEEAENLEKDRKKGAKTWVFHAENVRDFAWTSSRKFIWDAMAVKIGGKDVMAMSYYAKEANPLWEQYSTKVVAHTLRSYSARTFDYPYPVAISVEASNGMEYPMICFNYGRPDEDGTYSEGIKNGMISVIIHEVGHNFFPMIVNSDERQWTWMDEGLNTFLQFLAEQDWDRNYPSQRGPAHKIVEYMRSDPSILEPVMTNSENIIQFGPNAYAKPATALNILRETVMGRELFDYAFKQYAQRWKFKHPTPEDFFRTMEDASGVDLDWFWRGWFFGTDPVDISIEGVKYLKLENRTPAERKAAEKVVYNKDQTNISRQRNEKDIPSTYLETDSTLNDFYTRFDRFEVLPEDIKSYERFVESLTPQEKQLLDKDLHFYEITFKNEGGLVMPVIVQFVMENGEQITHYLPAEIWRMNEETCTKVFSLPVKASSIVLDPFRETADIDESNNVWPSVSVPSRFELFKSGGSGPRGASRGNNPMKKAKQSGN